MSREEILSKQLLAEEIAEARAILTGQRVGDQWLAGRLKRDSSELIKEAQLLQEAVALRQRREVMEHVRAEIERERAWSKAESPVPAS